MNKIICSFLSSALVVSTSFAGPIVNKMNVPSAFNNQISAGIEMAIGKSIGQADSAVGKNTVAYYETFPVNSFLSLTGDNAVQMATNSVDVNSAVMTSYISMGKQSEGGSALGLRLVLAPQGSRLAVSQQLAEAGLIKTGDIMVSARPMFTNSLQYLALQLVSTHVSTAVVVTENGRKVVYNIDMPMDADMLGGASLGFGRSVMDSNHFTSENDNLMLHILRPRYENAKQRENMQKWLERALARAREKQIYPAKISFNTDYNSPMYRISKGGLFSSGKADLSFVGDTGRLMLGQGLKSNDHLQMYCSEFAWTMQSLRNCDPDTTVNDFKSKDVPSCVSEFYKPMQMFGSAFSTGKPSDEDFYGMTDGVPLLTMQTGSSDAQFIKGMIDFALPGVEKDAPGLSSGHKGVASAMAPLIAQSNKYFQVALLGQNAQQTDAFRAQLNPNSSRNYSPTAFIVHGIMPDSINGQKVAQKKLDYVASIKYVPGQKIQPLIMK